jgi:hypothetical protein
VPPGSCTPAFHPAETSCPLCVPESTLSTPELTSCGPESILPQALIIFGAVVDEIALQPGEVSITLIATGFGQVRTSFALKD